MHLKEILKDAGVVAPEGLPDIDVARVVDDSRSAAGEDLFIAVKGVMLDGSKFINDAISRGARAVVSESDFAAPEGIVKVRVKDSRRALSAIADNFYRCPSSSLSTVGVTGTNGKTTVTYIMESILNQAGFDCGVIGTINYRIKSRTLKSINTTPGPLEMQSLLARMVDALARYAVMEISSHSLDQGRVDRVGLDAAIFTNITPEHLDYHKNMDEYLNAKKKIFDRLKSGGAAILNSDDSAVAQLKKEIGKNVLTYGIRDADIACRDMVLSIDGSRFTASTPKGSLDVSTRLIGMHNVSNILACIAAALHFDIDFKSISNGIEFASTVPGRLERIDEGQLFRVFVDYAHTEDALKAVLGILREHTAGRVITVFGCGGNRDRSKRPLMGRAACTYSDHAVMTSDNPRNEEPLDIIGEIEEGVKGQFSNYTIEPDRRKAIFDAIAMARGGDIVLIAGKGHEDCQIIKDKALKFDDRLTAREALRSIIIEGKQLIKDNEREALIG